MGQHAFDPASLTKRQRAALRLLGQGGARYGTMIADMKHLQAMGLARTFDTGKRGPGRWTWRPTPLARSTLAALDAAPG